jgi:hypothetical protein
MIQGIGLGCRRDIRFNKERVPFKPFASGKRRFLVHGIDK